jgi:hypothetical protein
MLMKVRPRRRGYHDSWRHDDGDELGVETDLLVHFCTYHEMPDLQTIFSTTQWGI